ncbi:FAD-dependent oxidoreductase [Paramicrobacterium sp. CJ85]|uniref:FAD-dependent oxidoreductase n=1 Tax=Paramicrobacterium sp. CJ85 TaxID=3445355 RepID=UPI003F5EFD13
MTSLWLARHSSIEGDALCEERPTVDEIVVGAGLTGLITAVLLAREGRRVTVLEARTIAGLTTGNSTAKLTVLQGARLQQVRHRTSRRIAEAYLRANQAGQTWMLDNLEALGVDVQRRTALSYATTVEGTKTLEREFQVARELGLPVRHVADPDLPFPTRSAIALDDQAQFDPVAVALSFADELRSLGGTIRENVRVFGARATSPARVRTTAGEFTAQNIVLATGTPILDRGLYFAKLEAHRSYAASYRVPGLKPLPMCVSVDEPGRSVRTAPDEDGEQLIVGGGGHVVGRHPSPRSCLAEVDDWAWCHWPGAERTHVWSAQDYEAPHGVPFVGRLPRGRGRILLATGYDKWGMTNAVQCALTLSGTILGGLPDWARTLHHRITGPVALARGLQMQAGVAKHYLGGYARALRPLPEPGEGRGVVGRRGTRLVGSSRIGDERVDVSPICTHLGAIVTWNDEDQWWDCPAHGSRFDAGGCRLEGPACRNLKRLDSGRALP